MPVKLRPFWRYYGGKWRAAPRYPKPEHAAIVEPFAGAAGYSLRYPDRQVVLIEKYPVIAEIWRYLIGASADEIRRIPYVEHVDDLPGWVPQGARWLVGFCMNSAAASPRKSLSTGRRKMAAMGRKREGWSDDQRDMVADQVQHIRHWRVFQMGYERTVDFNPEATWFVDPPYNNRAGSHYVHSDIDYPHLAQWCMSRNGQVIVCENEGADWLPFRTFGTFKANAMIEGHVASREVIWTNAR